MMNNLQEELKKCWDLRKKNFGNGIYFYAPSLKRYETSEFKNSSEPQLVPISVTGDNCALNCDHCKAEILKSMHHAKTGEELLKLGEYLSGKGTKGLLISGGSNRNGIVPLHEFIPAIKSLKERYGFKILVHTGLVDEDLARELSFIDLAMLDIIGSEETIKQVYHLDAKVGDFENSLRYLCENNINVAPHVVIGLHYGKIKGERKALEIISRFQISSLVLVGLLPLPDTPMEGTEAPSPEDMAKIFTLSRLSFPNTPILLGCERSFDERIKTEKLAIQAGLNGIAYPSDGTVSFAKNLGLMPRFSELCCSLIHEEKCGVS